MFNFYFHLQTANDDYQETYRGTVVGPEKLEKGSIVVVQDPVKQKYLAVELGNIITLNNKYNVWTTGNEGLYIRILEKDNDFETMPIKKVTPDNTKPNLAMSTLGQFITEDIKIHMKEAYDKHLRDICIQDQKNLAVSFVLTNIHYHFLTKCVTHLEQCICR